VIRFQGISKHFNKAGNAIAVLDGVSFDVREGEFISIIGPSGCGKSTLLNMAAGLMQPSAGAVLYRDRQVDRVNSDLGYVTQRDNLLPWRTVRRNVELALEIRAGTPRRSRRGKVDEALAKLGLAGFEDHFPAELSGGMRKRVTLARTLIYEPETVLMDEPFGALDAQLKMLLQADLLRLWNRSGWTIAFVTHDLMEAVALSDRVVVMSSRPGRVKGIVEIDLPRPRDVFRVRFSEQFMRLHERVWDSIKDEVGRGEEGR
jgi:NitT/TauT family transport system ATP-binding protein